MWLHVRRLGVHNNYCSKVPYVQRCYIGIQYITDRYQLLDVYLTLDVCRGYLTARLRDDGMLNCCAEMCSLVVSIRALLSLCFQLSRADVVLHPSMRHQLLRQ